MFSNGNFWCINSKTFADVVSRVNQDTNNSFLYGTTESQMVFCNMQIYLKEWKRQGNSLYEYGNGVAKTIGVHEQNDHPSKFSFNPRDEDSPERAEKSSQWRTGNARRRNLFRMKMRINVAEVILRERYSF